MQSLMPKVLQAIAGEGYIVYAYINDGTVRKFDMASTIQGAKPDTVWAKISDKAVFHDTITVLNETVAWDIAGGRNVRKCIDIDPCSIQEWPEVKDPLE